MIARSKGTAALFRTSYRDQTGVSGFHRFTRKIVENSLFLRILSFGACVVVSFIQILHCMASRVACRDDASQTNLVLSSRRRVATAPQPRARAVPRRKGVISPCVYYPQSALHYILHITLHHIACVVASSAKDISPCVYGEAACPGNSSGAPSSGDDTFCAAGYTGALCGTCVRGYFFAWGEESCQVCQSAASHKATMRLWAVLCGACGAIAFAIACVVSLVDEFGTKENKAFLEAIVNTLNSDKALSRGVTWSHQ